jgi:hypothetical protein
MSEPNQVDFARQTLNDIEYALDGVPTLDMTNGAARAQWFHRQSTLETLVVIAECLIDIRDALRAHQKKG